MHSGFHLGEPDMNFCGVLLLSASSAGHLLEPIQRMLELKNIMRRRSSHNRGKLHVCFYVSDTAGWCMFLGDVLFSWRCKKQDRVSKSSTEAEYRVMSTACSEIVWLRGLLEELGFPQTTSTPLHVDNTSAIEIATNPVFHERTKNIEVDCHSI